MRKIKIAIVTPRGAEDHYDNYAEFILAKELDERGNDIRLYTYKINSIPGSRKNCIYKGIKVIRSRQRLGISPGLFFSIIKFKPDVVMLFHSTSFLNFSAYLAGRMIKAKIISEVVGILHNPFIVDDVGDPLVSIKKDIRIISSLKDFLRPPIFKNLLASWINFVFHLPMVKADMIVAINQDERKYIKEFYKKNSVVIYWSTPKYDYEQEIKPLGIIPENYLLFIGQVKKRKGWDTALEALKYLKEKGIIKNLVFVHPTKNSAEAEAYVDRLGLKNQVFFLSGISNGEKNWLYNHAQYVLVPSRYEGFGLPVFEAFRAGKPVLATDFLVFLEFLTHKKNAMISKISNAPELAENILTLDNDPALEKNLIAEGYKSAERFSSKNMVDKYMEVIKMLVKDTG